MSVFAYIAVGVAIWQGALNFIGMVTWTIRRDFAKADSMEMNAALWFILAAVILK